MSRNYLNSEAFRELDSRHEETRDYRQGKNANLAGRPYDGAQNVDWIRGWCDAEDDRSLDLDDGQ